MDFWESSEIHKPAREAFVRVARYFCRILNEALPASSLAQLDCEFRYVPIVMPEGMRERYPARSGLRRRERVYVCSPQLDYLIFVGGTFESQVREYATGIIREIPKLKGLGASDEQVSEFEKIVGVVAARALVDRPDVVRH